MMAGTLVVAAPARAAMTRPAYDAGDRWVYVLQGSLDGLPGFNASQNVSVHFSLNGIVQVAIDGVDASGVHAATRASGFLNGTFGIGGNASASATGTFSSSASELWETRDFLPVVSNGSTVYIFDVSSVISAPVRIDLWTNVTTAYANLPPFELGVGDSVTASFTSQIDVASSFSFFGFGQHMENRTTAGGTWARSVTGLENVTEEAGTFSAYRLNESLGGIPGIAPLASGSANETAWFSNDTGSDVRRVSYVNGSPVAEMRLKSYTYPVTPEGLSIVEIALLSVAPIAAVALVVFFLLRRRKGRRESAKGSSGAGPVGELPPRNAGGRP